MDLAAFSPCPCPLVPTSFLWEDELPKCATLPKVALGPSLGITRGAC